jgi:light-regulated signal transduction histidine kinase (bacteriophytochrome)
MTERLRETMTSRDELERSNRELDDFAYIASHDLKEPLRGIHNYASFLLEDYQELLPGEGRDKLHAVGRLARRMEDLINALLHYSRLGRGQLADETVNMNGVLAEVIESLHLDSRGDKVAVHCPSPLPPVRGDRTRIAEVLQNLVGNAIKYNDSAEKRIEIQCLGAGDNADHGIPADHRVFRVADNGIGIRDKHLEDVFRIFKRLHRRDKYPGGTGAGLTIVRKVVERHGGVVWVESGQGEGSRFFFTLPAHIDTPGPDAGSEIAGRAALSRTSKGT